MKIAAFSKETSSVGNEWLFQSAIIASSANIFIGLISSYIGIFNSFALSTHFYINVVLYFFENGPAYDINADVINISPLSVISYYLRPIT